MSVWVSLTTKKKKEYIKNTNNNDKNLKNVKHKHVIGEK